MLLLVAAGNGIGPAGFRALSAPLPRCSSLSHVDLGGKRVIPKLAAVWRVLVRVPLPNTGCGRLCCFSERRWRRRCPGASPQRATIDGFGTPWAAMYAPMSMCGCISQHPSRKPPVPHSLQPPSLLKLSRPRDVVCLSVCLSVSVCVCAYVCMCMDVRVRMIAHSKRHWPSGRDCYRSSVIVCRHSQYDQCASPAVPRPGRQRHRCGRCDGSSPGTAVLRASQSPRFVRYGAVNLVRVCYPLNTSESQR